MTYQDNNNITIEGVNFTVEGSINQYLGWDKKYANSNNKPENGKYPVNAGNLAMSMNAIEIDWNNADWSSVTPATPSKINTTSDLLKAIKYASTVGSNGNSSLTGGGIESITLNGVPKTNDISFYAPTSAGRFGDVLTCVDGVPTWMEFYEAFQIHTYGRPLEWNKPVVLADIDGIEISAKLPEKPGASYNDHYVPSADNSTEDYWLEIEVPNDTGVVKLISVNIDGKGHFLGIDIGSDLVQLKDHYKPNPSPRMDNLELYTVTIDDAGHITSAKKVTIAYLRSLLDGVYELKDNPVTEAEAVIGSTSLERKANTSDVTSISWTGGSVSPSQIAVNGTGTLNKGTVKANYNSRINSTTKITISNFTSTPTFEVTAATGFTENPASVVSIGSVNANGEATVTATGPGHVNIIVKDGSTVIETFEVTVEDAPIQDVNVTSLTVFSPSAGSINGTTITAPSTTGTVTITASYGGKSATISYTVIAAAVYYFGTTLPTSSNYNSLYPSYSFSSQVYGKEVTVTGGLTIYYLCPSNKELTDAQRKSAMLDQGGSIVKFSSTIDRSSISGYTIYNQHIDNSGTLKFNVNY